MFDDWATAETVAVRVMLRYLTETLAKRAVVLPVAFKVGL